MSETLSGNIEAVRKDNKGIKVSGEWYSVRNASALNGAGKGDTINATFERNGKWNNLDEASIKISAGQVNTGKSSGSGGGSKGGQFRTPDEIMRTEALNQSLTFHTDIDPNDYGGAIEKLLKTADLFTAYAKGLIDVSGTGQATAGGPTPEEEAARLAAEAQAEAEAAEAAKQAEAAAATEAAASAPSALSSFLGS